MYSIFKMRGMKNKDVRKKYLFPNINAGYPLALSQEGL